MRTFKIWKTVKLGTGLRTSLQFQRLLDACGYYYTDEAIRMIGMRAFQVAPKETMIDLVVITVSQLGFVEADLADLGMVYKRANAIGLELCPNEVGPQLRLQFHDKSRVKAKRYQVAMKPMGRYNQGFCVSLENGDQYLGCFDASFYMPQSGYKRFVFWLPGKNTAHC